MIPEIYKTGESAELIQKLLVTGVDSAGKVAPYQKAVVFSMKLTNIKAGDVADLQAYGQASNSNKFAVSQYGVVSSAIMFCYGIIITDASLKTDGIEAVEVDGTNITYEIHHSPWDCGDWYTFTQDYAEVYINVIVYAASMAIKPNSTPTYITIDADYGRLTAALFRKF